MADGRAEYIEGRAVLIGINDYEGEPLQWSRADAIALYAVLTHPRYGRLNPENVDLLLDGTENRVRADVRQVINGLGSQFGLTDYGSDSLDVLLDEVVARRVSLDRSDTPNVQTIANLRDVIRRAAERANTPEHVLILFFSGHAAFEDGEFYLLPQEAQRQEFADSALRLSLVKERFSQSRANPKLLILDACYAGIAAGPAEMVMRTDLRSRLAHVDDPNVSVVASCLPWQTSLEHAAHAHGIFTFTLLEALLNQGEKGYVTLKEAYDHVNKNVPRLADELHDGQQTPLMNAPEARCIIVTGRPPADFAATCRPEPPPPLHKRVAGGVLWLDESEQRREIRAASRSLAFTPILGAECSLIGRERTDAWITIGKRIKALLNQQGMSTEEKNYLRSLRRAYRVPRTEDDNIDRVPAELVDLQTQLTRLGSKIGKSFGAEMAESVLPVINSSGYRVPVKGEFEEHLVRACVAAFQLQHLPDTWSGSDTIHADDIYDRLIQFARELTDGRLPEEIDEQIQRDGVPQQVVSTVVDEIRDFRQPASRNGPADLYLHQLEWLADLVWYTFRHDAPCFPSDDELAFQVQLVIPSARGHRLDLVSAIEKEREDARNHIIRWFSNYDKKFAETKTDRLHGAAALRKFYDNIAALLWEQHNSRRNPIPELTGPKPVAFSMNFDLELENALEEQAGSRAYHVALPVYTGPPDPEDSLMRKKRWLLGTRALNFDQERAQWEWTWEWCPEEATSPKIQGPLVVKLHGSPLHLSIPKRTSGLKGATRGGESLEINHALTLSESEYLTDTVWRGVDQPPFQSVLSEGHRHFYFLGQPVAEWNVRLRMFAQLHADEKEKKGLPRMVAINRHSDPGRTAVLNAMLIERWQGNLALVADLIEEGLAQYQAARARYQGTDTADSARIQGVVRSAHQ